MNPDESILKKYVIDINESNKRGDHSLQDAASDSFHEFLQYFEMRYHRYFEEHSKIVSISYLSPDLWYCAVAQHYPGK